MDISIVGSGYVGLVTGACLAQAGNSVLFISHKLDEVVRRGGGGAAVGSVVFLVVAPGVAASSTVASSTAR